MPSDTRTHSSNQEALLLDQALDAVNQRLHSIHQPLAIAHKPQQARNGLVQAVGRARERGIDFHTEYQRLSNGALDAMGVQPAVAAEASKPAADSAADPPPPQADARPQAPSPAPSASAPAPAPTLHRPRQRSGNDQTVPRIPGKARAAAFRPDAHRRHQESARNPGSPALTAASGRNTARPPRYGRGRPDEGDRRQPSQVPPESVMTTTVHRIAQAAVVATSLLTGACATNSNSFGEPSTAVQRYRPLGAGGPKPCPDRGREFRSAFRPAVAHLAG